MESARSVTPERNATPEEVTWFVLRTGAAGPLPVVNWSHVEDGQITRILVTFDPRPLLG